MRLGGGLPRKGSVRLNEKGPPSSSSSSQTASQSPSISAPDCHASAWAGPARERWCWQAWVKRPGCSPSCSPRGSSSSAPSWRGTGWPRVSISHLLRQGWGGRRWRLHARTPAIDEAPRRTGDPWRSHLADAWRPLPGCPGSSLAVPCGRAGHLRLATAAPRDHAIDRGAHHPVRELTTMRRCLRQIALKFPCW